MKDLRAIPVEGIGEIRAGDSLADIILEALEQNKLSVARGDVRVVTHKVVSKAEGHIVPLATLHPSAPARRWAQRYGYDPRVVELALAQSRRIVRQRHGVLVTETLH